MVYSVYIYKNDVKRLVLDGIEGLESCMGTWPDTDGGRLGEDLELCEGLVKYSGKDVWEGWSRTKRLVRRDGELC